MGSSGSKATEASNPPAPANEKPKCKACCACPETKKVRDVWLDSCCPQIKMNLLDNFNRLQIKCLMFYFSIIEKGEENCTELIEAHKACMREQGFNI